MNGLLPFSLFKNKPKTPAEHVKALHETMLKFHNPEKSPTKVADDCSRLLASIKAMCMGNAAFMLKLK